MLGAILSLSVLASVSGAWAAEPDAGAETADAARADGSAAGATALDPELFQALPIRRTIPAIVELAPGVSGRIDTAYGGPGRGHPVARGEGQFGNNVRLDGVGLRDPASKTLGFGVNFDAIEYIDVYTDGLPAELGRATGMVVDIRTRSGGEAHHGSAGYWFDSTATGRTDERRALGHELSLTAGGPVVADRLWYFAAAQLRQVASGLPDDAERELDRGGQGFAKLTWFTTPELTLQLQSGVELTALRQPLDTLRVTDASAAPRQVGRATTHLLTARWRPTDSVRVELRGASLRGTDAVVPVNRDDDVPSIFDLDTGLTDSSWGRSRYDRRSRLGGSALLVWEDPGVLRARAIRFGADAWELGSMEEVAWSGAAPDAQATDPGIGPIEWDGDGYSFQRSEGEGFPCTEAAGYSDCRQVTEYTEVGPVGNRSSVQSAFAQADWELLGRLGLSVGLRVDREVLRDNGEEPLVTVDAIVAAPRLGARWDVTGDGGTRVFASAGRAYDLHGNDLARWANGRSATPYPALYIPGSGGGYDRQWVSDPAAVPLFLCTNQVLDRIGESAWLDLEESARTACGGNTLRSYHLDEIVLGVEHEILPLLSVRLKGIASRTNGIPDDLTWDARAWVVTSRGDKRRDYRGLELAVRREYDGVFQLLASYTLSTSRGHAPGQYEAPSRGLAGSNGNGVTPYLDGINDPGTRTAFRDAGMGWLVDGLDGLGRLGDPAGHYGYLPNHSLHVVELSGSYTLPWGTSLGLVYELDSGHPWARRGLVEPYGSYLAFPDGRGTRTLPATHSLDLRVAHRVDLRDDLGVELTADAFNLLDLDAPITVQQNDNALLGETLFRQAPRSVRLGARFTY